jgi:hypothetical protein
VGEAGRDPGQRVSDDVGATGWSQEVGIEDAQRRRLRPAEMSPDDYTESGVVLSAMRRYLGCFCRLPGRSVTLCLKG